MDCCGNGKITVVTSDIPAHTWNTLAAGTLELLHSILAMPGGREALDAKKEEIRAKRTASMGGGKQLKNDSNYEYDERR